MNNSPSKNSTEVRRVILNAPPYAVNRLPVLLVALAFCVQVHAQTGIYVNPSNNVGIGTASPTQKLSVAGNILVQSGFGSSITMAQGPSDTASLALTAGQPGATVVGGILGQNWSFTAGGSYMAQVNTSYNASALVFNGGTTGYGGMVFRQINASGSPVDSVTINGSVAPVANTLYLTGGKVGIGTTSPVFNLHTVGVVASDQGANTYVTLGQDPGGSSSPTTYGGMYFDPSKNLRIEALSGGVAWRNIVLQGQGNGNVGIGTTNPAAKLHIHGNYANDGSGGFMLDATDNGNPEEFALRINPFVVAGGAVGYQFQTKSSVGGINVPLTFDNAGNVGIGTTSPAYKLDVAGQVHAASFVSSTQTYADFVFKPGYKLEPLSDVEASIQKDGHLPGIPSEAEAKAHGIDLASMQVKLLQKIEELTLHQIEQEKLLKNQTERLDEQSQRIGQLEQENTELRPTAKTLTTDGH